MLGYLDEQRQACGHVPDDRTIVVERFRDELGDWRVVVHSPFGAQVHAPWALALGARLTERFGLDAQVLHADDGIVLRLPDIDLLGHDPDAGGPDPGLDPARWAGDDQAPPIGAADVLFEAGEVDGLVTEQVGGSALFAARFRECAARALLLPRRDPGRRTPCGNSVSGPPICSRWPASSARSRSSSKRSASAFRTSSTCRGLPS